MLPNRRYFKDLVGVRTVFGLVDQFRIGKNWLSEIENGHSCKKMGLDPRTYIKIAVKLSAAGKSVPTPLEHARIIPAN